MAQSTGRGARELQDERDGEGEISEVRSRRSEVRGQTTDDRRQKIELNDFNDLNEFAKGER